jgi:hypothetical protein
MWLAVLALPCRAIECFRVAIDIQPHDSTYVQLGKVYTLLEDYAAAIQVMPAVFTDPCSRAGRFPQLLGTQTGRA